MRLGNGSRSWPEHPEPLPVDGPSGPSSEPAGHLVCSWGNRGAERSATRPTGGPAGLPAAPDEVGAGAAHARGLCSSCRHHAPWSSRHPVLPDAHTSKGGPAGGRKALDTLLHCSRAPCSPGGWGRKPLALSASMLVSAWSPQDRRRPWASCPLSSAHSSPRGPGSGAQLRAQPRTGSASPGTLPRSFPLDEPPGSQGCLVPV